MVLAKFRSVNVRVRVTIKFKVIASQSCSQDEGKVRDRMIRVRVRVRVSVQFRVKFCIRLSKGQYEREVSVMVSARIWFKVKISVWEILGQGYVQDQAQDQCDSQDQGHAEDPLEDKKI